MTQLLLAFAVGVVGVVVLFCLQSRETLSLDEFLSRYQVTSRKHGRLAAFSRIDRYVMVACALAAVALMFALVYVATEWNNARVAGMPGTVSFILPSWPFYVAGVLLGYGATYACRYVAYRLSLGKEFFLLWRKYYEVDATIPLHRLVAVVAGIGLVAGIPCLLLGLDTYVRLTDEAIAVNSFWSLGEDVQPLANIRDIYESRYVHDDKQYLKYRIEFRDGSQWHSEGGITMPVNSKRNTRFVTAVARRAGVHIIK